MKPTLKPGCLAMIVKSAAGNEGKIVTCMKFIPEYLFVQPYGRMPAWEMDQFMRGTAGVVVNIIPASWLVPINDPDLEIETKQDIHLKEKV